MEICCRFLKFPCFPHSLPSAKKETSTPKCGSLPSVDEERALQALSILKLEQVRGAREGEASGLSVTSLIQAYKDSLKTGTREEARINLDGLRELFWHMGIALTQLHTHEAGAEDVYEKTIQDSLEFITAQSQIIEENLKDPKLIQFACKAITADMLIQMAQIYVTLNDQKEIHGSITVGDLKPENIYVEMNPKGFAQLTLVNTETLSQSLNSKGEGMGFAFNDVIHMVHATIEYCIKQDLNFEDLGGLLEDFIKGYQLAFKIRLQDLLLKQNLDESKEESLVKSYVPRLLYPLMSLKVMTEIIARNLSEMKEMHEDDPLYAARAKIISNTIHTLDCETSLFRKILLREIDNLEKTEPSLEKTELADAIDQPK